MVRSRYKERKGEMNNERLSRVRNKSVHFVAFFILTVEKEIFTTQLNGRLLECRVARHRGRKKGVR